MTERNATQAPNDNAMHFTKQSFMGIELDILLGHPEHDILFIATQVARAAGLKNPSNRTLEASRMEPSKAIRIRDLPSWQGLLENGRPDLQGKSWMFSEPLVYQMLLRGHAPASEPFRKWVTEVVLPSIRKTGKFDINEAQDATSQQFAGEFAALHAEIAGLKAMLKELLERPVAVATEAVESPYEGTRMSSLSDGMLFDKRTYREVGEAAGLDRISLDRLEERVVLSMEIALGTAWANEDGRPLKDHISKTKRKWTQWPSNWVKSKMDRVFYRQILLQVLNEKIVAQ
ncbi:BRO-N domain-containing protein [Stutzerimonas stutzeri]|uniref:BRO-N domain-containing protein n=1 Tax=Stutzerimonas stutzeri TaxID=316 RepID=UPI003094C850